jgi:hypothetical protein
MTMEAGAGRVDITPPLPADLLGYVRRARAARSVIRPLFVTALVLRDAGTTIVVCAADLVGLTTPVADAIRAAVGAAVGCDPAHVLLNSSRTHAAPWPGARWKLGGEFDEHTDAERQYEAWLPSAFASAAVVAAESTRPARVSGRAGHAPGLAVNRRERTEDGRTILGWRRDGFASDEVAAIRIDDLDGPPIATVVGFGCHPVVVGPEVEGASPDFVGPLRERVESLRGGLCLFLQGAAGDVLPLEAFQERVGGDDAMGERLALEAVHAVADAEPRVMDIERTSYGSVTPIGLYRRRPSADQPAQSIATRRAIVPLPLLEPPALAQLEEELAERRRDLAERHERGEGRATTNPVRYHVRWLEHTLEGTRAGTLPSAVEGEIWAARLGSIAIVGAPGEIFGAIGQAVREGSPAEVTLFAGYSNGVLGYVATPEEYPFGGYEPAVSHRGYGPPAPFSPDVAGIIRDTALGLLRDLFPADDATKRG